MWNTNLNKRISEKLGKRTSVKVMVGLAVGVSLMGAAGFSLSSALGGSNSGEADNVNQVNLSRNSSPTRERTRNWLSFARMNGCTRA